EPSEETVDEVFNKTSKFEIAIANRDFQEVAEENEYVVKPVSSIKVLDENIPGLGQQRSIVRWAFEDGVNVGDFRRFNLPSGGYVIAVLSAINKEGVMSNEKASVTALPEIRKEKKAKMIREKITANTLDEIAANQVQAVRTAVSLNMKNPTLSGAGREPIVVGTAFGLDEGETSGLIDGSNGVYMIQVTKKTAAAELPNYQAAANRLLTSKVSAANTALYNALKDAADVEDNRSSFY
ncbi:MAG: peptidylprolyl isomerase, partial [Flavobacteriaceae bacterium]|nr:peptidylprolyl isomerase [Flavobacteriaceae bacterium]